MESQLIHNINNKLIPIICEYCSKQFHLTSGYLGHLKQEHLTEVSMEINEIKEESGKVQDILEAKDEYTCKCGIKFKQFIELVRHESKTHIDEFESMVRGLKDLLLYVINKFDVEIVKEPELSQDVNEEPQEFETQILDEDFFHDIIIEDEQKFQHNEIEIDTKQPDQPKYICQYCGKQLAFQKSLELHLEKVHKDIPLHQCNLCSRNFRLLSEYEAHQRIHELDPDAFNKRQKYNTLTLSQKKILLDYADQGMSLSWIQNKMKIPKSTVQTIKKNRDKILEYLKQSKTAVNSRSIREVKHPELEQKLYSWYLSEKKLNIQFTQRILQRKAMELHGNLCDKSDCNFKASLGFIRKFRRRHEINLSPGNVNSNNSNTQNKEPEND